MMLTKSEREFLQALSEQLRRAHAHEVSAVQMPVHISKVISEMPELEPARA